MDVTELDDDSSPDPFSDVLDSFPSKETIDSTPHPSPSPTARAMRSTPLPQLPSATTDPRLGLVTLASSDGPLLFPLLRIQSSTSTPLTTLICLSPPPHLLPTHSPFPTAASSVVARLVPAQAHSSQSKPPSAQPKWMKTFSINTIIPLAAPIVDRSGETRRRIPVEIVTAGWEE